MHDDPTARASTEEIVADSIRAVGAIYMAWQLEELRLFDVVDRLVDRFAQGMLAIRDDSDAAALRRYYSDRDERFTRPQRFALYSQVLGAPQAEGATIAPNRAFDELWLAFLYAVTELDRQQRTAPPSNAQSPSVTSDHVRLAGRRLAANATSAISGATPHAAQRLIDESRQALEILKAPEVLSAYGVQSPWAVIDRVAASDLAAAVPNIARHRTLAEAGKTILDLLAAQAESWSAQDDRASPGPSKHSELLRNAERWLTAAGIPDAHA